MTNQTNTQKAVKGLSSQTIVTVVLGVVEIISFSIMSRLLSEQDFGYYAAIVAVSTIFSSLSSNGIGAAIVQRKQLNQQYIDNAFSLSLLIGIFVSGLLCVFSGVLARSVADESMQIPLMLYSSTLLLNCIISVNMALMQRELRFIRMGLVNLISLILTTIVAVVLALRGHGYYAILTKAILGSVITVVLSYYFVHVKYSIKFDINVMRQIFGFSGWLMASSLFRNFANQIDRLLMSSLFSVAILGVYSRPKEFVSNITDKFNSIFDTTLFPILSSIQDEEARIKQSYKVTLFFLNFMGMFLSMMLFCNSELVIRIFFGEEWLHIRTLFQIISFSSVLYVNGRIGDIYLRSLGLTRSQLFFRLGQLVAIVVLIVLLYKLGIFAVAIAAMIGYFIIAFLKVIYISRHIKMNVMSSLSSIVAGWKFLLFLAPFYLLMTIMLPHTIIGNIVQLSLLLLIIIVMLLFTPLLIGNYYKNYAYSKVVNFFEQLFHRNTKPSK